MFQRCVAVDFYDFTTKAASQYGFTMQYYNIIILQSVKRFLIKLKKKRILFLGNIGAIRNDANKLCIVPKRTDIAADHSMPLEFASNCHSNDTLFEFTKDGTIKHQVFFYL